MTPSDADHAQTAWREFLQEVRTEPMTIRELASEWFKTGRNTMSRILAKMEGVERCGKRYRVPLAKMPPAYLVQRGILPVEKLSE